MTKKSKSKIKSGAAVRLKAQSGEIVEGRVVHAVGRKSRADGSSCVRKPWLKDRDVMNNTDSTSAGTQRIRNRRKVIVSLIVSSPFFFWLIIKGSQSALPPTGTVIVIFWAYLFVTYFVVNMVLRRLDEAWPPTPDDRRRVL
jgi:hypothetical protein